MDVFKNMFFFFFTEKVQGGFFSKLLIIKKKHRNYQIRMLLNKMFKKYTSFVFIQGNDDKKSNKTNSSFWWYQTNPIRLKSVMGDITSLTSVVFI